MDNKRVKGSCIVVAVFIVHADIKYLLLPEYLIYFLFILNPKLITFITCKFKDNSKNYEKQKYYLVLMTWM